MAKNESVTAAHFLGFHKGGTKFYEAFLFASGNFDHTMRNISEHGRSIFHEIKKFPEARAMSVARYGTVSQINVGGKKILKLDEAAAVPINFFLDKVKDKSREYTLLNLPDSISGVEAKIARTMNTKHYPDNDMVITPDCGGFKIYSRPLEIGENQDTMIAGISEHFYRVLESFTKLSCGMSVNDICLQLNIPNRKEFMEMHDGMRAIEGLVPESEIVRDEVTWGAW